MKTMSLIIGLAWGLCAPLSAQEAAPPAPSQPAGGLKFVAIDKIPVKTAYLYLARGQYKKISIRTGTPGERVPVPENRKIIFVKEIPAQGQRADILMQIDLPSDLSERTIVALGNNNGTVYAVFIDETKLEPGTALFKNMTTKSYLIDMPTAPGSEPKRILLEGGKDHLFGSRAPLSDVDGQTYPAVWRHEITTAQGKAEWFIERKMMVSRHRKRATIFLVRPAPGGRTVLMHEIILFLPNAPSLAASP